MKKFSFLILDACIVIKLHELGIWNRLCEKADVHLAETVIQEAKYYEDEQKQRYDIDLRQDIEQKRISSFSVDARELNEFFAQFDPNYAEKLDLGERESLAYLFNSPASCMICSSDAIVYKILALMNHEEQGRSLQEVLEAIGLHKKLPVEYLKVSREKWTRQGKEDKIRSRGLRD